ncbi:TPA: hypothetical protein KON48_002095 [Clostridioides difficile]|uniref:hypothetical protein n=1 Tax=Clostridioides difficile TaxID=1496 RepID=UPI001C1660D1|nr:hypothetical protein [Clostridioides difficile]MCD8633530.1 hypothetical protein [Clostridioides difficile]MCG3626815.1 hypothetical protein [Clostridioides difficile]MCI9897324.1 hypothetical protein [Clostridioides difficile]MCO4709827.1 hypothetical protein [Clostridioides difficile]MCP8337846.1 hypothetical protein [Clostridioides difficile]
MRLIKIEKIYKKVLITIKQTFKNYNDKLIYSVSTLHKDEHLTEEKLKELENWVKTWEDED